MSAYEGTARQPEPRQLDQFECRWRPNIDFSPVASSMLRGDTQWWFDRISLWVMHAADGEPAGNPTASVRYGVFDDGQAALAWRLGNPGKAELTPARPEVTRVLTGPAELLTPDVAVVVCHTGLPTAVGPRPGEFSSASLPPVSSAALRHRVTEVARELDYSAAHAPGLAWLVAAALQDRARPLAVQLPDSEIAMPPADGRQAALLWGLHRILCPLLTGLDGQQPGARDWSFSTFEPPFGTKDPAALPGIVFRKQRDTRFASSTRDETLVRPSGQHPLAATDYDAVAGLLVRAFGEVGSVRLAEWLRSRADGHPQADERIRLTYRALHEQFEPGAPPPAGPRARRAVSRGRPASTQPGRLSQHAPAAGQAAGQPVALTSLLRRLDGGPGPEFDAALHAIAEGQSPSTGSDRTTARQLLADRGWFLLPLLQRDPWHYVEALEAIFRCTVVPDLGDSEVLTELTRWVDEYAAPHEVVVALDAAARRMGYTAPDLEAALLPSLGRRWMAEHGIRAALPTVPVSTVPLSTVPLSTAPATVTSADRNAARPAAPPAEPARVPGMFARERLKDTTVLLLLSLLVCNILLLILQVSSVLG